jgi:hypothetical protein
VRFATLIAILLAAGCASPNRPQVLSSRLLAPQITWGDLKGLRQQDIRQRLGLPAADDMASFGVALEGDVVVTLLLAPMDLVRRPCGSPAPEGYHAFTRMGEMTLLTFRDGKLVDAVRFNRRDVSLMDQPVEAKCEVSRVRTFTEELGYGQGAMMLALPILLPFALPGLISNNNERNDEIAAFAELRLGEPPPGGLDAFVKAHEKIATVIKISDTETQLRLAILGNSNQRWQNEAILRDGRVVELKPYVQTCLFRADRSLLCGQTAYF